MNFYILQMKVNGIKNISKEVVLNFYNKTLKPEFDLNDSNIKSIYGPNGSGKSGLINAVDIYKKLLLNDNYLSDSGTLKLLNEMINKKINKFSIEVSFLYYIEEEFKSDVYTHRVEIEKDKSGYFKIVYEKLEINKKKSYDSAKRKTLIEIKNGEVINTAYPKEYEEIAKYILNLLDKQSVVNVVWERYASLKRSNSNIIDYLHKLTSPAALCVNLNVIVNESDTHYSYLMKQNENGIPGWFKMVIWDESIKKNTDVIRRTSFEKYKKNILKLEKFIQIFKSDLKSIDIEFKEDRDVLICEKYFNYDDYRVLSEFESTGIKKLIELFNAFYNLTNGEIVFIDELDANLHDVYLCKLIEYFSMYAKGQLCFTTHNLTPMEVLKKRNYSIDFLSEDSTLTSWRKNGNYSVSKFYREGMIENSPFNIEAFDFIGLFEED